MPNTSYTLFEPTGDGDYNFTFTFGNVVTEGKVTSEKMEDGTVKTSLSYSSGKPNITKTENGKVFPLDADVYIMADFMNFLMTPKP
jgi:hypothetical protein